MTVAAIYARYSSDNQRDESIEIQVELCTEYIERCGWELGEVFTDYARTGTHDRRPNFQRAVAAGEAGEYDVLVYLKNDRFARNVADSRRYKEQLKKAGRRIVSVREGESEETPSSFLHEVMDEAFAEYYSRNLSALIRDGNRKNAEKCKASGTRIYGYDVDESDHFVVNERQAAVVHEIFDRFANGQSVNAIAAALDEAGIPSPRGGSWGPKTIAKMLKKDRYVGVYRYAGHVTPGGMPAIVDRATFDAVQAIAEGRASAKRRSKMNDYVLTSKLYCLECGGGMYGKSGKSGGNGRKYTYYSCEGGCGFKTPAKALEEAVLGELRDLLLDDGSVDAMVADVLAYAESLPDESEALADELAAEEKRKANLVKSLADGVPAGLVKDELIECGKRIETLEKRIRRERARKDGVLDETFLRGFIERFIEKDEPTRDKLLFDTFVDSVYAGENGTVVLFGLDNSFDGESSKIAFEDVKELAKATDSDELPSSGAVRGKELWWRRCIDRTTLLSVWSIHMSGTLPLRISSLLLFAFSFTSSRHRDSASSAVSMLGSSLSSFLMPSTSKT